MGLSVFLPPGSGDTIEVDVWYADYDKLEVAIDHEDKKKTGWKRVRPPPMSGSAGETIAIAAKRLKNASSGPKITDGRRTTACGTS